MEYRPQLLHALFVAGPEYRFIDFFSYDVRLPENLRIFCVRLWRDEQEIDSHAEAVKVFLDEIAHEIVTLTEGEETPHA